MPAAVSASELHLWLRKTFFLRPFGRIDRELRRLGCDVSVADIDGFGTVENNAARLKEIVSGILAEKGCGLQVGLVNKSVHFQGLQIGVLNFNEASPVSFFPIVNFAF